MPRRVVISGLGPVSGLGIGIEPTWQNVVDGNCRVRQIGAFDPAGFDCRIASEVQGLNVRDYVPKSYRKAVKVMARDIELAVAAADGAARDAQLTTKGTANGDPSALSYPSPRMGAHIGAGLIAAELNELTTALAQATDDQNQFDYHKWGQEGMMHLSPLWLLKYLPNMLACHVTIIHDTQGPSNTITCGEASGTLSIGESLRVIQRGAADLCFCGGFDSKINPMAFLRQQLIGWLNTSDNDQPERAVRPFCQTAAGTVVGEGGAIVILEARETFQQRCAEHAELPLQAYAEVLGFGASQSIHRESRNLRPDPQGQGIALAIQSALREAELAPDQIDLIIPYGSSAPEFDQAEANALKAVFGDHLDQLALTPVKAMVGNCGAGAGCLDVCIAAKALATGNTPAVINCDQPIQGLPVGSTPSTSRDMTHALVYSTGLGGQNAALVLKRYEDKI